MGQSSAINFPPLVYLLPVAGSDACLHRPKNTVLCIPLRALQQATYKEPMAANTKIQLFPENNTSTKLLSGWDSRMEK